MAVRWNTAKQNALAGEGVADLVRLRVYTGSQPASANDAPTGTLLVIIPFVTWGSPAAGVATITGTPKGTALATGDPGWGRFDNGSAETLVMDGEVGSEFTVNPAHVIAGGIVTLTSGSLTQPSGA